MSTRTTDPITTGTSILGLVYKDGVLLACDTLASYGSLAYWQKVSRIAEVATGTALAASGEFSDFQEAQEIIGDLARRDRCLADGHPHDAREIWSYMSRIMYQKRNKMDPLYNSFLIAGMVAESPGLSFLLFPLIPFFFVFSFHFLHGLSVVRQTRTRRDLSWASWICLGRRLRPRSRRRATACTWRCPSCETSGGRT